MVDVDHWIDFEQGTENVCHLSTIVDAVYFVWLHRDELSQPAKKASSAAGPKLISLTLTSYDVPQSQGPPDAPRW